MNFVCPPGHPTIPDPVHPREGDRFLVKGRSGVWIVQAVGRGGWTFFVQESMEDRDDYIIRSHRSDIEAKFFAALTPVES